MAQAKRPSKQQPRKKSMQPFYAGLAVVAAIGVIGLAYIASKRPAPAATRIDTSTARAADAQGYDRGKPDAPVTIMEFGDLSCSHCAEWSVVSEPEVRQKLIDNGLARFTYYDFILVIPNSIPAHNAAACAGEQGKFWEMHDRLYHDQGDWAGSRDPKPLFKAYVTAAGANATQWEQCYDIMKFESRIAANTKLGESLGVHQTPTFVIGGRKLEGAYGYDSLKVYVDAAMKAP